MTEVAAEPSSVVRAVFFGSGSFAVPILDALAEMSGVRVAAVVSTPDRPIGRKAVVRPTPVTARAREIGLPILQPARVRLPESIDALRELAPDLIVLADYGQLIPRVLLDLPALGFLNLHPSALPRHRGASPIPATILAGDTESAVSLTAVTLEARAAVVAAVLLRRALPEWLAGRLGARRQPTEGVTMTRPLRREDGRLDTGRSAVELERQVRAYQPWPGSFIDIGAVRIIVWSAHAAAAEPGDLPGRIVRTPDGGLALIAARGRLVFDVVRAAGRRSMSAAELVRGHPDLLAGWSSS